MFEMIGLLLAITAALDLVLKPQVKIHAADWLHSMSEAPAQVGQNGYQYVEKIFGNKLLSYRAVSASVLISIASLLLSYGYAFFTSDFELVWVFRGAPTLLSTSFFILFLAGSVFGDVLSYAQTRVFLRTIDQYRAGVVSLGLALADAVVSLALFICIFSCTRLIVYLVIISGLSGGQLISSQVINLDLLQERLPKLVQKGFVTKSEVEWLQFLSHATDRDASIIDNSLRFYNQKVVGPFENGKEFSLNAKVLCAPYGAEPLALRNTVQMLAKSTAGFRGFGELDREYGNIVRDLNAELSDWRAKEVFDGDKNCAFRVLKIDRKMSPSKLMNISGPVNAWWAAFEMTFYDAYASIGYKFGPYASIDPFNDINRFYESMIFQSGYSFFDMTYADPNIPYLLSEFSYKAPTKTEEMQIPYSPMLASSLAVSMVFWVYIAIVFISRGLKQISFVYNVLSYRFDVKSAPFTSVALVITFFVISIRILSLGIDYVWNFVF